jgi:hypothetical protein
VYQLCSLSCSLIRRQTSYFVSYIFYHIQKIMAVIILDNFKVNGGFKEIMIL